MRSADKAHPETVETSAPAHEDEVVSLSRALAIVEQLADAEQGLTLADISRHLDVNKAIGTKLLRTLELRGYVFREVQTGRYHLTYRISNLGLRQLAHTRLLDQSSAVLRELAETSGELVRLAVVEDDRLTWVLSEAGRKRSLQIDPNFRFAISLHTHATGKAWLSTMPFERALTLLLHQGLTPLTKLSKTSIEEIRQEIETARSRGYAVTYEENEMGVAAVAAPIVASMLDGQARCVGTISLAAPTNRMTRSDLEACSPLVVAAARKLAATWPIKASVQLTERRAG
jgi:IclR family transcriptional regulator, acetate operon repressor